MQKFTVTEALVNGEWVFVSNSGDNKEFRSFLADRIRTEHGEDVREFRSTCYGIKQIGDEFFTEGTVAITERWTA